MSVSISMSVCLCVCVGVWTVTAGETVGYSIADKGGLSTLICVRALGGMRTFLCVCVGIIANWAEEK